MWVCQCECGIQRAVDEDNLQGGLTRSCGCLKRALKTTHGETGRREYNAWTAAKARCYTQSTNGYPAYGGRGITMGPRWRNSFSAFLEDMGRCPPGLTLDRINNDGNYEPGNCRWASPKEQSNNTRSTQLLTFQGQTLSLTDWARHLGFRATTTIKARLRRGWPLARVLVPPRKGDHT
jgi:hypothetical protein